MIFLGLTDQGLSESRVIKRTEFGGHYVPPAEMNRFLKCWIAIVIIVELLIYIVVDFIVKPPTPCPKGSFVIPA